MASCKQKFLIITDSRGRDLKNFINTNESGLNSHFDIEVRVRPGRKFEELKSELTTWRPTTRLFKERTWDYAILAGGICNLTTKSNEEGRRYLRYVRDENTIQHIIDLTSELSSKYSDKINIVTIPPACLTNYFKHNNQGEELTADEITVHSEQQAALEEDINRINSTITSSNIAKETRTIDWAQKTYSSSLKKKRKRDNPDRVLKLKSSNLPDGVHPDEKLRNIWFQRVTAFMWKTVNNINSDFQTEDESWNFKRKPNQH